MRMKTRAISEGAMILAMIVIVLIVNRQLATMLELLLYFISVPIIIYTVKYGMRMGSTLSVSIILMGLMFSSLTSLFYLVSAIGVGLIYAYGCIHHYKSSTLLLMMTIMNLVVTYITVVMLGAIFGYDIQSEVVVLMEYIPTFLLGSQLIYGYIVLIVVVSYLALALMQAFTIHMGSVILLKRLKVKEVVFYGNLALWRIPKIVAIIGVAMIIMYLFFQGIEISPIVVQLTTFIAAVFFVVFIVDGFITSVYYLQRKQVTRGQIILLMICCLLPILQIVMAVIGVYDIVSAQRLLMKAGVHNEIH